MSAATEVETGLPPYPYPGLRPFRQEEAVIFFGRDQQVDELLSSLDENRFLAVVGPSGCGKSSLVRAGMIPALETGFMASAGFRWRTAVMRLGDPPFKTLAKALLDAELFKTDPSNRVEYEAFHRATFRRGPLGLLEVLQESRLEEGENLLLLVDQFEEIFRFQRSDDGRDEARAFVDLLLASAEQDAIPIYVVITMRSDFLGSCPVFAGLPEAMNESQFLTPRLTRRQLETAIVGPASLYGTKIEPELLSCILNEMGTDPDQLPLMQHLLMKMWANALLAEYETTRMLADMFVDELDITLTRRDYRNVGGLAKALSNHAEGIYKQLESEERRRVAKTMFRCLTEITPDGHMVRCPSRISQIAHLAKADESDVTAVVDEFRRDGRSFLMPPETDPLDADTVVDISHESLIRQWDKLREWTRDEDKSRRVKESVSKEVDAWEQSGRDDVRLLDGVRLAEALEWAEARPDEMDSLKQSFLEASEERRNAHVRKKQQFRYASAVAVVLLLLVGTVVAWIFTSIARQKALDQDRLVQLSSTADVQSALLASVFQTLNQDTVLLAKRTQTVLSSDQFEDAQAISMLQNNYHDMLVAKPLYMQARFIGKDGIERVRAHREHEKGDIQFPEELQSKGDSDYVKEAMKRVKDKSLSEGKVYLSDPSINKENGEQPWEYATVRALSPVFSDDEFLGFAVINIYFHADEILAFGASEDSAVRENCPLIDYLTNERGQFLFHPNPDLSFGFERGLTEYRIDTLYPNLTDQDPQMITPKTSLLVEQSSHSDAKDALNTLVARYPRLLVDQSHSTSEKQIAVFMDLERDHITRLRLEIEEDFAGKLEGHILPSSYESGKHAVCSRKIFFADEDKARFLRLVLVHQAPSTPSNAN